jgi:hypothetical protein
MYKRYPPEVDMNVAAVYAKAIYATVVAFIGALVTVMVNDVGFSDISDGQWLAAVLAGLVAGGGVAGIKNAEKSS